MDRYSRQIIFPKIGKEGQEKLGNSSVVIIGCGALGGIIATTLVRAGVGKVKIVDRDVIEYHNLHRQILFDEEDIKNKLPKAIAAERHLKRINSSVEVEGIVADVNFVNIESLIAGADLILDGLDNLETRFLINDAALKNCIPWIYGGAVAASGMTMNIIPGETPCFRCVFPSLSRVGAMPTCDTAGIIGPVPFITGSLQSAEALKILVGSNEINRDLIAYDIWQGTFHRFKVNRREDCPACQGKYEFLQGETGMKITMLCGEDSVQISDPQLQSLSLEKLAEQLQPLGEVDLNEFMLTFKADNHEMVIFPDGRFLLKNNFDESLARTLYARYIGT